MRGRLPTFLVVGAVKAGTTSLFEYLRTHPDVFMPERKELSFFVHEHNWRRGLDWYRAQFADADGAAAVGEASPSYAWWPSFGRVPERIAATVPDVRLVYVVREPFARMRSMYLHAVALGGERRPIERALAEVPDYLDTSRYATQLERHLRYADAGRLLVVTAEDLRARRAETVRRVFAFLGVDDGWTPPNLDEELHTAAERFASGRRPEAEIPAALRARLAGVLAPEVERLARYLAPGFDGWGLRGSPSAASYSSS